MMPKVKTIKASKIQSASEDFPEEFMESPNNEIYCTLCSYTLSCSKYFLVESHRNTFNHQKALGSRSEVLIPLRKRF